MQVRQPPHVVLQNENTEVDPPAQSDAQADVLEPEATLSLDPAEIRRIVDGRAAIHDHPAACLGQGQRQWCVERK